jgi:hypothetical protein
VYALHLVQAVRRVHGGVAVTRRDDKPARSPLRKGEPPKTAVILIHGMGEQRPMGSLYDFVEATWSSDSSLVEPHNAKVYCKLSALNAILDLRRVTTRNWSGENPRRVDFFEYYWAHLMVGNTIRSTVSWMTGLLIRRPSSVPPGLKSVWLVGSVLLVLAAGLLMLAAIPAQFAERLLGRDLMALLGLGAAMAGAAAAGWLAPVAGDAARYFSPLPDNVTARENIIRGGVELVERLTRSGKYDRIIVVGHSLGSAIGLDIINIAFGTISPDRWAGAFAENDEARSALADLERSAATAEQTSAARNDREAGATFDPDLYRTRQRRLADALSSGWAEGRAMWLVSDFVTLGSPLSKAHVLIARDENDFAMRKQRRQVPTCPPMLERKRPPRFSFRTGEGILVPHHGAVFAPTVWTNIYFPSFLVLFGDIVSGAVAPLFGRGVRDVRMPSAGLGFRHLHYWRLENSHTPVWIRALRHALNLRKRPDTELWQDGLPAVLEQPAPAARPALAENAEEG